MSDITTKARTILAYSESGDTKTTQGYHLAKYIYEEYGLTTRWIASDPGGRRPLDESGLVEMGVVDVFDITTIGSYLGSIHMLSEGYWPRRAKSKQTGLPFLYWRKDDKCLTTPEQWNKIGLVVVDSITAISASILNYMRTSSETIGFKNSYEFVEEGYTIKGLDVGHYGIAQGEIQSIVVRGFNTLPVKMIYYTARVGIGKERKSKKNIEVVSQNIYGPDVAGNAITAEFPSWVEDCLHLNRVTREVEVKNSKTGELEKQNVKQVVAWFQNHKDPDSDMVYLAKARCTPEEFPMLKKKFPFGYVPMDFERGVVRYLDAMKELQEVSRERNKKWKEEIDNKRKENG
jgi:hypothetical protein